MSNSLNPAYNRDNISMSVIRRLPRYYRYLNELQINGISKISSKELSQTMGFTASQIRQDFNCFGGFGQQGYGYNVSQLRDAIGEILDVGANKKCIMIGAGNLGKALLSINFERLGFNLLKVFDNDPDIIGTEIKNFKISSCEDLADFCTNQKIEMAIICVPSSAVKELANTLYENNVKAFWNFSHFDISLIYSDVKEESVHLNDSLMALGFMI